MNVYSDRAFLPLLLMGLLVFSVLLAVTITQLPAALIVLLVAIVLIMVEISTSTVLPELPLAVYFFLVCDPFKISETVDLRLVVGGVKPWDFGLLYCGTIACLRLLRMRKTELPRPHWFFWGWWLFAGASVIVAYENGVPTLDIGNELRRVLAYGIYPIGLMLIRDFKSMKRLLIQLGGVAFFISCLALVETVTGGEWSLLTAKWNPSEGFTGLVFEANFFVSAAFVFGIVWAGLRWHVLSQKRRVQVASLLLCLGGAIVATLRRNLWFSIVLVLFFFLFWSMSKLSAKVKCYLIFGAAACTALVAYFRTSESFASLPIIEGITYKIDQILDPDVAAATASVQVRLLEDEGALAKIRDNPFFGIGLGSTYYAVVIHPNLATNPQWVHNGYLWIAMKIGILGLGFLLAMIGRSIVVSLRRWKEQVFEERGALLLGFGMAILQLMLASSAEPVIMDTAGVPAIALLIAMIDLLVIFKKAERGNYRLFNS